MTEENNFLHKKHCPLANIAYLCIRNRQHAEVKNILKCEAMCFILTKREPENSPSSTEDTNMKVGNVVQLFPRLRARTSVIFHLQGFSGPPLEEYESEVCASAYNNIESFITNNERLC